MSVNKITPPASPTLVVETQTDVDTSPSRPTNEELLLSPPQNLENGNQYLYRPIIEVAKVVNATGYGALHGITTAKDIVCDFGAPTGVFSAITAIALRSGQENSLASRLFRYLFQNSLMNFFNGHPSQENLQEGLEFTRRYFINATPQEYFFSGLLQGALLYTVISVHSQAAKKGKAAAEQVEGFAHKNGFIKEKEKYSTFFAETAARTSAKISSIASITLLVEMLRYGFDPDSYQNLSFSQHVESRVLSPILGVYNFARAYFTTT